MDAEDEGGLVLEVSHSQPDTSLDEKIRGLIFKCNVQAVLAVRVHDYNNKGACIELWCPDTDEESRAMIYHKVKSYFVFGCAYLYLSNTSNRTFWMPRVD